GLPDAALGEGQEVRSELSSGRKRTRAHAGVLPPCTFGRGTGERVRPPPVALLLDQHHPAKTSWPPGAWSARWSGCRAPVPPRAQLTAPSCQLSAVRAQGRRGGATAVPGCTMVAIRPGCGSTRQAVR